MGEWLHSTAVGAPASAVLDVRPRPPEARRGVGAHGCGVGRLGVEQHPAQPARGQMVEGPGSEESAQPAALSGRATTRASCTCSASTRPLRAAGWADSSLPGPSTIWPRAGCAGCCSTPRRPTPQPRAPTPRRASGGRGRTSSTAEAGAPTAVECNHSPMSTESETQPSAGPVGHATERPAVAPVGEVELEVEADADAEPWTDTEADAAAEPWTDAEPWADAEPWPAADRAPLPPLPSDRFGDRELDWLAFNQRVLELAEDTALPLLERVRFLAIFASNLDEFFMVRVAGLQRRVATGMAVTAASGLSPREVLEGISTSAHALMDRHAAVFTDSVQPALDAEGIALVHWDELGEAEQDRLRKFFRRQIYPVLTPLAVDPAHPFPY